MPGDAARLAPSPPILRQTPWVISQAFFLWLFIPLVKAFKKPLSSAEVPSLWATFSSSTIYSTCGVQWLQRRSHSGSVQGPAKGRRRRLWQMIFFDMNPVAGSLGIFLNILSGGVLTIGRPMALRYAVREVEYADLEVSSLVGLTALLCCVISLEGLTIVWGKHIISDQFGAMLFAVLNTLVLDKATSTPTTKANPANLVGNDIVRSLENIKWLGNFTAAVGGIVGGIITLVVVLGWSGLVGLSVSIGIMMLNMRVSKVTKQAEKANLAASDHRLHLLKQMIDAIRGIKFFAWEQSCQTQITTARTDECVKIRKFRALQMLSINVGRMSPVLSCLATFLTFSVLLGEPLRASDIFASLLIFQSMRMSLIMVPTGLISIQNILTSISRIEEFLDEPDTPARELLPESAAELADLHLKECWLGAPSGDGLPSIQTLQQGKAAGSSTSATTAQISRQSFVLRNIELSLMPESLTAVLGPVGSGKSTLIGSLLGAVPMGSGSVSKTCRSISLVPQRAVILNATLEENIVMGFPFSEMAFATAVRVAQLDGDIQMLKDGIHTLIGERGTTLSGGQQMRLSIARAVYAEPRLLVLDDPLAALDHVVGSAVLEEIKQYVKSPNPPGRQRAALLVINQVHHIRKFDYALWLEAGSLRARGSPEEVLSSLGIVVEEDTGVVDDCNASKGEAGERLSQTLCKTPAVVVPTQESERHVTGRVNYSVYKAYVWAMGPVLALLSLLTMTVAYVLMPLADWWLARWVREDTSSGAASSLYPLIYSALVLLHGITLNLASLLFAQAGMRASKNLHRDCLVRVLKAPMSWFDDTPSGRTISRFSSDLSVVDLQLTMLLDNFLQMTFGVFATVLTVVAIMPILAAALPPLAALFLFEGIVIDRLNREVKRMRDTAMGPVQTNVSEVMGFAPLLQVDGTDGRLRNFFLVRHFNFTDEWNRHSFTSVSIMSLGQMMTYFVSLLFALPACVLILGTESMEAELTALAFTYCFLMPYFLGIVSMLVVLVNHSFTSLERLLELQSCRMPREAWPEGKHFVDAPGTSGGSVWPSAGQLSFMDVSLCYREGLPLAVNSLSLNVLPGERLGIVGRTGSGKSSILVLLFRLVEPAAGSIMIDGTDISDVGLHRLRSSLGMIPQSPVLFEGSLRQNLDPFDTHLGGDAALQSALDQAELGSTVTLDTKIGAGGSGLSAGECQLLSFARCLLGEAKVLVMDEPTASVDLATDAKVQLLIRSAFAGRTLFCIAHRLQSVIDFDRMLVMANGKASALGPPSELLADRDSALSQIVDGAAASGSNSGALRLELEQILGQKAVIEQLAVASI